MYNVLFGDLPEVFDRSGSGAPSLLKNDPGGRVDRIILSTVRAVSFHPTNAAIRSGKKGVKILPKAVHHNFSK